MADPSVYQAMPFGEAIRYLEGRISLPSDSWRDYQDDEFDAIFVSAGATGSILSELRTAVDSAIERGERPEQFQERFEQIAAGWENMRGSVPWRANLVYQTNLRAAYGRGRETYQFNPEVIKFRPFVRYRHSDADTPRPSHLALDGRVFRKDDPGLWSLPSGYGCACRWLGLSQRDLDRKNLQVEPLPRGEQVEVTMPDGQVSRPIVGPDEGWDRRPNPNPQQRRQEVLEKIADRAHPEIAEQIRNFIANFLAGLEGGNDGEN